MKRESQNQNRKFISRLAGKTSGWLKTHKMHLLAVGFMCAAVGLGTIEANTIYAENETGDYGTNGSSGSATYVSGGNIKVFPLEPAVTGVSVESYDFNEFLKTKYKYSGSKKNATNASEVENSIESWEESHKDKINNPYPYWIQTGTDKNGKAIYKYNNNSHHMITQNMLLNQTSKSFNKGTLIYVPKDISKLWIAKKEHSKVIVNGSTCKSAVNNLHFNYTYWYSDSIRDYDKIGNKTGSGIYYNKLKKYIKQQTKKETGKTYVTFINGDGNPRKGGGTGKKAKVADYSQISKLTKTELNKIIDAKTLDKARKGQSALPKPAKRAQQLIGSIANITLYKDEYTVWPEIAWIFLSSSTCRTMYRDRQINLTDVLKGSAGGQEVFDSLYSYSYLDQAIMKNLFQGKKILNKQAGIKNNLSYLQKAVINNEYNLHYLDLLVCGYADAYASGGAASADPWWKQIEIYVNNAEKTNPHQKNVVFRVDVGMAADVNGTVYYTSVGDMYAQQYALKSNAYTVTGKGQNAQGLNKGFVGFATAGETKTNNYQALNQEVSNNKGVVSASKMKNNYNGYYNRLKKAISSNKKLTKDNAQTWYGRTIMTRVTHNYYLSDKNGKVTEANGNALNAVELLKMQSPNNGAYKSMDSKERQNYAYGTYAIDGFNWIYPSNDDDGSLVTSGYKLYIYSKKAEGNKNPKSNGSNIKKKFESVSINKKTGENATYNQKDDVYVRLAVDTSDKTVKSDFKKIMNSKDYYVQVKFVNSKKTNLDGEKKDRIKSFKYNEKTIAPKQIKNVSKDFNKYSSALAKSEKNQNYNVLVNGKSVGGKVAIENNALIWHVKNTTLAEKGMNFKGAGRQYVAWRAKVYIYKRVKGDDGRDKWINIADTSQVITAPSKKNTITILEDAKCFQTNNVIAMYTYKPGIITEEKQEVDLSGTYFSTPQAYAELKEGSIYNETFEAMAGVPTTRTLYFATGGSEFIVNMQAVYDDFRASGKGSYRTTRTYKSVFKGTDCEYKSGDTLKPLEAGQTKTETFVSDNEDKKNEKTVTAEKNNAVNPIGASSYNTSVHGHTSATKFEATWEGTIANNTPAWTKVGSNTSPTGKPCESGNAGKVYSISTKPANWDVSSYNTALSNAQTWAKAMEQTNDDGTVIRIADSDGYKRIYKVGDATIKVTLTGGEMNYSTTGTGRTYGGGTYTSSNLVSSAKRQNTSGDLGTGWGFTKGSIAVESGSHVDADPEKHIQESHSSWSGYVGSTDGASPSISYTIKVTFKDGSIDAKNYDGKVGESGLTVSKKTGLTQFGAHAMCGACCEHVLPQIEDVWTQKLRFDTIRFTNLKVWKLDDGYATGMSEIRQTDEGNGTGIEDGKEAEEIKKEKDEEKKEDVQDYIKYDTESKVGDNGVKYDEDGNVIRENIPASDQDDQDPEDDSIYDVGVSEGDDTDNDIDVIRSKIVRYDPNIFYNIAQQNTSKAGRIRYSLQTGQDDNVTWTEFNSKHETKRTDFCDGQTASHSGSPVIVTANGHKKSWCKGCLYSNKNTNATTNAKINLANRHDNANSKGEAGDPAATKTRYSADKTDAVDKESLEWKRFDKRRKLNVTATVISDFLILQTSSGNQSILYYDDKVSAEAQKNYKDDLWYSKPEDMNNLEKQNTQKALEMWTNRMWTNNPLRQQSTSLNIGGYNGNYSDVKGKYNGSGNGATVDTAFDNDEQKYNSISDTDENGRTLNLAEVQSARRIETAAEQDANARNMTEMTEGDTTRNLCSPGCGNIFAGKKYDTSDTGSARMSRNTGSVYKAPTKQSAWGDISWGKRIPDPGTAQFGNAGLVLLRDGIAQCPTNENKEYVTGQSYAFYLPILTYDNFGADDHYQNHNIDEFTYEIDDNEANALNSYVGKNGYTMESIYTDGQTKVNNIVVHNPVSVQYSFVVGADKSLDQRVLNTDKGGAADMNKEAADDTCPGTAVDCQFRILNCKYAELIRKAAFSMDNATQTRVDPDDDTNTSTYETIVSDITSNGGNYSEAVLEGSGFSLKRYDGKEAFEGVSEDDAVQPDRYLYGSGSTGALYFSWDSLGIDSSVTTDSYEIAGDFTFREQSPAAIISTEATQLVKGANGKLRLKLANGDEYQSADSVITQNKKYRIQYQFGFDSVTMKKSSINVKGTTYNLDINTKVYVNGNYVDFIKVSSGKDTMSVFAGNGFYLGNKDESNRSIDYNVDNLAITRLPGSTKHTAACFNGEEKHAETMQNYYNGVSDKSTTNTASEKVEKTFEYTGKIQSVKLQPGTYTLEAWGASGGQGANGTVSNSSWSYGKGGYSKGTLTIDNEKTLYVVVGGRGLGYNGSTHYTGLIQGGYNGGGDAYHDGGEFGGSGGGATSIFDSSSVETYNGSSLTNGSPATTRGTSLYISSSENYNIYKGGNKPRNEGEYYRVEYKGNGLANSSITYDGGMYRKPTDSNYDNVFRTNEGVKIIGKKVTNNVAEIFYKITKSSATTEFRMETNGATVTIDSKTVTKLNNPLLVSGGGGGSGEDNELAGNGGSATTDPTGFYDVKSYKGSMGHGTNYVNTEESGGGGGGGYVGGYGGQGGGSNGGTGYASSLLKDVAGNTGEHTGNGLVKITGTTKAKTVKSIDWTGKYDNGENIQNGTNNTHTHTAKCLTANSEGLQIALDEASSGNTTDLEKMLGAEVWSKVKTQLKNCYGGSGSGNSGVTAGKVYTYDYTGSVQNVTLPAGVYKLETWGASGGGRSPGQGGYSTGTITIDNDTTLYICVGQKAGTYNGGGTGDHGYGGGATHIATANGVLSSLSSQKDSILLVAGGGAGGSRGAGGAGGGANMSGTNGGSGCGTIGTGATVSSPGSGGYSGSFGKAGSGGWNSCGGGGGYYGGGASYEHYSNNDDDDAGGGGGSGYAAPSLKDVGGKTGEHSGNGLAKITVLEAHTDYDPVKVYNVIKSIIGTDYSKIPTYVTTNGHTIVNPIWNCKNKFDGHKCTNKCETVAKGNVSYELSCSEPHHTGNHYDVGNEICYDACHNDEAHKAANNKENATNTSKKALTMGDFILLDNYFQVYYPNMGDFYDTDHLGVLNTEQGRGHGYVNKMDTTEWTREKWIRFPYNVLYNRNGVWEEHQKDEWFQLEICKEDGKTPQDTYDFYCQLNNSEMSAGAVEFAVEAINNRESPYGSENPYGRDGSLSLDCAQSNDSMTNKDRSVDLTAKHSVYRQFFIDVVGRIGNLLLEDTGDMRFSNFFKKSLDEWDIDGIVHKVDQTVQNMYLSWHKNNGDTATDIRGEKVSPYNEWYNTYTTAKWTDKGNRADKVIPTPLAACKNNIESFKESEQLKFGYNLLWDISTIGDYYGGHLQIEPKYYALDTWTDTLIPVDVYINSEEETNPINYFGLMNEYGTDRYEKLSKDIYDYTMNINWRDESARRNYSTEENKETTLMSERLGKTVFNSDGTPVLKTDPETGLESEVKQPLEIPHGDNFRLGNTQFLYLGDRAKTFIGNSKVTALHNDINGSNNQELFKDFSAIGQDEGKNKVTEDMYYYHAQRWHSTLGLPSSVRFVDASDKNGDGLADHKNPYDTITFEGEKMYAWEQFDEEKDNGKNKGRYVYLETADITAIGEVFNLKYDQGKDNGTFDIISKDKNGNKSTKHYSFGNEIPTLLALYGNGTNGNSNHDYDIIQMLFCKLNDAPVVTLNDAVTV